MFAMAKVFSKILNEVFTEKVCGENTFNKIKINQKNSNHFIVLSRILVDKLNWLKVVHFKTYGQ